MPEPLRIGVIGLTHDHIWDHLSDLVNSTLAEFVGVAESNKCLQEKLTAKYRCRVWDQWSEMLAEATLDAVFVYADNRGGAEAAVAAAESGLHVLIEKPMAADFSGARAMLEASNRAGTRLMVNWPFAWWSQMQDAIHRIGEGQLGRVWQVKYRAAHAGPEELGCSEQFCEWLFDRNKNGGGAMMDYCCYGTTLARAVLGQPEEVLGITSNLCKTELPVEDNAMIVMRSENTLATAEASWTQIGKLTSYTTAIYGTEGSLIVEPRAGGRLLLATADKPNGFPLTCKEQAPQMRSATEHFIHHVHSGEEFFLLCRPDVCCDSQEILEAGKASANSGSTINLPFQG